jgi:pimeloyl-ACP methyl ester carboxylesterase
MTTFVVLHGAGGRGGDWDLVASVLEGAGHRVLAVDLPCDRPVGLEAYVDVATAATRRAREGGDEVVLVAHSLAGLVAPVAADREPVDGLVLCAAMVPAPGETGGEWWQATGHAAALEAQDLPDRSDETVFLHDVPAAVLAAHEPPRDQTSEVFDEPCPLEAWPDVPTRFVIFRDDRFFPRAWLRDLVVERIGVEPVEVPGGHCAYLSEPDAVAAAVLDWEVSRGH